MRPSAVAVAIVLAPALTPPLPAQEPVELRHRSTFPEAFGYLQTVRELADGSVLVADPLGGVLAALDVAGGTSRPLGREGGGPGEWRQPDAVHALPGDSSLLVDLGNARLTVIDPAGRLGRSQPMVLGQPAPGPGGMEILLPRGTDDRGGVYYQTRPRPMASQGVDSAEVRRWDRGDAEPTTLARLRPPATTSSRAGGASNVRVSFRPIPLSPQDDWAPAADGRIAVVRAEPYRVDWVAPDGRITRGDAVRVPPVRVGPAEQERWLEELGSSGLSVAVMVENGAPSVRVGRGGSRRGGDTGAADYEWPDVLPPFRAGGTLVAPDGRVWVERYVAAGAGATYDLFDDSGRRTAVVRLPEGRRVIGFGRAAVYVVRVDDLGLHWLEVYDPPRRDGNRRG